ncbi:MAG: putative lipid II flippase FtsW [Planctomycetes bacterium]|nr:putative lipid II flippase FtsW [Planctomycetota bacterium]
MLDIIKNATDMILNKTRQIVSKFKKNNMQNTDPKPNSDTIVDTTNINKTPPNIESDGNSNYINNYAAHCYHENEPEEDTETEYKVRREAVNIDIKPLKNMDEPLVSKIPTTKKIAKTLQEATVKIKDSSQFVFEESQKIMKFAILKFDAHLKFILFSAVLGLISIGIIMIFSASSKVAMQSNNIGDSAFFVKKHLFFVGLSFIALYTFYRLKLSFFQQHWKIIATIAFVLLIAVLIPGIGKNYNGARRWIRFGSIGFQPSDFAKIAMIISLSVLLVKRQHLVHRFKEGFLPLLGFLAMFCALIVIEPDFGTALFLGTTGTFLMLIGGVRFKHLVPIVLILLPVMSLFVIMKFDHIKPRIEAYMNPEADPMGKGYQNRQAKIALGKGGLTGVGLGKSHQALYYLPEESTDFIFAIVGEELGFIGTSMILILFMLIMLCGLRLAYISDDMFAKLLATGLTSLIVFQALINMMVVTATAPNKGISLPFISFGGSLTFFYAISIGIILRIADETSIVLASSVNNDSDNTFIQDTNNPATERNAA